jgi:hypothetical protein
VGVASPAAARLARAGPRVPATVSVNCDDELRGARPGHARAPRPPHACCCAPQVDLSPAAGEQRRPLDAELGALEVLLGLRCGSWDSPTASGARDDAEDQDSGTGGWIWGAGPAGGQLVSAMQLPGIWHRRWPPGPRCSGSAARAAARRC